MREDLPRHRISTDERPWRPGDGEEPPCCHRAMRDVTPPLAPIGTEIRTCADCGATEVKTFNGHSFEWKWLEETI